MEYKITGDSMFENEFDYKVGVIFWKRQSQQMPYSKSSPRTCRAMARVQQRLQSFNDNAHVWPNVSFVL